MEEMIVIVDFDMGNSGSILNMLKKIGKKAIISGDHNDILSAKKLILPGVGSFDKAMSNLVDLGLIEILNESVIKNNTPILGICLGMELLAKTSLEGKLPGLGWINSEAIKFLANREKKLPIPHMGWNTIEIKNDENLFKDMPGENRFYFAHSYYIKCEEDRDVLATTNYGLEFSSAVARNNVYGVQFHPEKSHKFGKRLLKNYVEQC